MKEVIELRLIGITYNQIENGVYALILEAVDDGRRLAIVIGYPEAQSIECHLQRVSTPRPLAHDLLASILRNLEARLLRVDIHRLPTGPYAGKLTIENSYGEIREIDARSSDAIALAIRVGAPIYTTKELLDQKGYNPQNEKNKKSSRNAPAAGDNAWKKYTDSQLLELIEKYVSEENYEAAAEIKIELEKRKNNK